MRHYYHEIVHAQKEILFATMYWEKSESANIISKAFRDLSKRAGCDNCHVIIKLMIDHPTISSVSHFHYILPPSKWSCYDLPSPEEIPNISLEVHNYHHGIMGTFHTKFLIVDRKLVLLNSNNIQDRPNLEMMSQFEGDIVNSFYDTFLISWWLPFQPNLVCLNDNAPMEQDFHFGFSSSNIASAEEPIREVTAEARSGFIHLEVEEAGIYLDESELSSSTDESSSSAKDKKPNRTALSAVVARAVGNNRSSHWSNVFVKATNHIASAVIDYDGSLPSQSPITKHLNKSSKSAHSTTADKNISVEEIETLSLEFSPFLFHRPHEPFPIVLVNRLPHGTPGYKDTINPQDAAWLGAFRHAQKSIFIQSPTFNASSAIDGIVAACRRGVKVTLWLGLGFNDLKEGHGTFQGGTNEHVVKKLYKRLKKNNDGTEQNLETFWYTAKGQLNNAFLLFS
jgi:phosphatidylserine/phosphatidylglycerophosphate/cardiolipin synthase-like enzyme